MTLKCDPNLPPVEYNQLNSPLIHNKGHDPVDAASPGFAMLASSQPRKPRDHRVLSIAGLVAIAYLLCCTSPAGNEPLVTFGGPLTFFVTLICLVVFYTIPISYVVAELSSAFPDDGGVAIWVMNAFGPFWGFQAGFWIWLWLIGACVVTPDTAYYRFGMVYGYLESKFLATLLRVTVALVLAVPSFFTARVVAKLCMFVTLMVLIPYFMFTVAGFARGHTWDDLFAVRREVNVTNQETGTVEFSGPAVLQLNEILTRIFYGFDGIVLISVFGGEVANPAVTYSSAIFIKLAMGMVSYILPFSSGLVYGGQPWPTWHYGTLNELSQMMGSFMGFIVQFSADCSNAGFYLAAMFSQAYLLCGMAHVKLLPRQVAQRSERFGTPNVAAYAGVVAVVVGVVCEPKQMTALASAFSALCQLMVIVTIIRLRLVLPEASRPTKVPGNLMVLCTVLVIPVCILVYMVYTAFQTPHIAVITAVLVLIGFVLGFGFQKLLNREGPTSALQRSSSGPEQEITFGRALV